jgi:hypothetical protein
MVSNIGDNFKDTFPNKWPQFVPDTWPPQITPPAVSKADFEALRREVQELKKLLIAANEFDKATGQPHCEMDEKVKLIKAIAKMVGVDLSEVFEDQEKPKQQP